jgi:hypothetical protein
LGNPHARVDFNPTSKLNSRKRTDNFGLRCELDEQVRIETEAKEGVPARPGRAHGQNNWNLPFRHIYYASTKVSLQWTVLNVCLGLFSIVLYGSNSETHAWHGTFDPQLLDLLWQDSQQ